MCNYISESNIILKWHWYRYHFDNYINGSKSNFATALINGLLYIDRYIDDYAKNQIDRIASINSNEGDKRDYEQLMQICGEIYVIKQVVEHFKADAKYELEPISNTSKKNPEINIHYNEITYGIEVKVPSLLDYKNKRNNSEVQILTRFDPNSAGMFEGSNVLKPRDNPVKDFLISANEKFKGFKKENDNYVSVLFILWDDCIQDPISALLAKSQGLLTNNSFAKNEIGEIYKYENLDYIFIDRFIDNCYNDAAERSISDNKPNFLHYGTEINLPIPYIKNPFITVLENKKIIECFKATSIDECMGAEYCANDLIFWLK